ncbi:MAG: 4-hydroxythreonine-4-phosphate dehydrogenase PdxA [Planctomycetota bacterium]|jgi:4-hydroxythreonine-4-phosphate dehydrogenase|nr:4-hydroxythreonine-4-phosphate dehydrogenase PdxA [Planctomycetota bacterium]
MPSRPLLGVTMGDPAGVGPEIAVKALLNREISALCRPLLIGDAWVMRTAARDIVGADCRINSLAAVPEFRDAAGILNVLDLACVDPDKFEYGRVSAMCGEAAYRSVAKAIELALAGEISGTVTNPLNKEALNLAGRHYAGHTEIFSALTGAGDCAMLLMDERLRVIHVTTHIPLRLASERLSRERILAVIRLGEAAVRRFGPERPRIGVAGFNPHSGENGLFGSEEREIIAPAVAEALAEGFAVQGPLPADTIFAKALGGAFDLVVAMYHDQGHIPLKLLGFRYDAARDAWPDLLGVNITLGLPIIRASVDHGTAFDRAGRNQANPDSLVYAIKCAARLAGDRPEETGR